VAGQGLRGRLGNAAGAFVSNVRNPDLRRAQLSFLGAWTAEWAFTVGLGIVAYRDGGATAVGLVGLLRMVPSAVVAPLLSPLADRGRRERVLIAVSAMRGAITGAAAVVVGVGGPTAIVADMAFVLAERLDRRTQDVISLLRVAGTRLPVSELERFRSHALE
jgi:hypothetical protein